MMLVATNGCPLVSVLIAVHNPHPRYFPEALQSILGQMLRDLEFLVVEAASPRSGRDLLADVCNQRNRYISHSERACLAECRAEFVADAADVSEPARLQRELEYLHNHQDVCTVGCQMVLIDGEGNLVGYHSYPTDPRQILKVLPRTMCVREQRPLDARQHTSRYPSPDAPPVYETARVRLQLSPYRTAPFALSGAQQGESIISPNKGFPRKHCLAYASGEKRHGHEINHS